MHREGTLDRATLYVDLGKVRANARRLTGALGAVEIVGVTKVTCGSPEVGAALLDGGAVALGESRLENAQRLRDAGLRAPLWLLRAPTPGLADEVVRLCDVSLQSEVETVRALDRGGGRQGRRHGVVAMVELGDLREGMMPADLPAFADAVGGLEHVDLLGVGVNLTCYGTVCPSPENLGRLAELAAAVERRTGRPLRFVSGGNSGSLDMAFAGRMPAAVNSLRVGESILLGVDTLTREPLALGLHLDAFTLEAPVIECLVKPSLPDGICAQDAFGNRPVFVDRGERRRAICALGRQDAPPEGLRPLDPRVQILGASSDHLILDVHDLQQPPSLGDPIAFVPTYAATLQLFTSQYVHKVFTPPA
jgi:predicted amino acid racemase